MQSRYYDPQTGRFISPDAYSYLEPETVNGLNLYSYCNNNPVMNVDPSGHIVWALFFITVGVSFAVGFGASVVSQTLQYGKSEVNYWQAAVDGLFSAVSTALAFTGIGLPASMAAGGVLGYFQYAIDSDFHNEKQTFDGALFAIGSGIFAGYLSGAGASNIKALSKSLYGVATKTTLQMTKHMVATGAKLVTNAIESAFVKGSSKIIRYTITHAITPYILEKFLNWIENLF